MRKTVFILIAAILLTHTAYASDVLNNEDPAAADVELPSIKNVFDPASSDDTEQAEPPAEDNAGTAGSAEAGTFRDTAKMEGDGYASPEEAVSAYVEAMNAGDINAMAATFAIETYIDHLDAAANAKRQKAFLPASYSSVPAAGPLSRGILIERRRNEITESIYNSYLFYATADTDYSVTGNGIIPLPDDASVESFITAMNASPMESWVGNISITKVCSPDDPLVAGYMPDASKTEKALEHMADRLAICGGDEYAELIAVMDVNGSPGAQFMECIRYGDRWYNWGTLSTLAILLNMDFMTNGLAVGGMIPG